jgi:hypothetical protein
MKIKCKECNGEGAYEYACWEQSKIENCECSYCDGQGYIEEDIEEWHDQILSVTLHPMTFNPVTNVDEKCDKISDKFIQDAEAVFMTFTGDATRNYHVTYFISRGEVTAEETPLLGGLTLSADSITHAIIQFMTTTGVDEKEIKYIVEL